MQTAIRRLLLSPPIDSDVVAWKSRVIAAGGTVSSGTVLALSRFSKACKAAGLWEKLNRVNLFCGDQLAAALIPLKVGAGSATDTNVNFVSGDYTEATGLAGNGSTKYLDTGVPQNTFTAASRHIAAYVRVVSPNTFDAYLGSEVTSAGNQWYLGSGVPSTSLDYRASASNTGAIELNSVAGFLLGNSPASTTADLYRNGASVATAVVSAATPGAVTHTVFAMKRGDATLSAYALATIAGYSIGTGLSAAEAAAYNTIMEQFQDALGRGVQ